MRVSIDEQKCQGHARCLAIAPTAFDFDDESDMAFVLPHAYQVDDTVLEQAVNSCPERAISRLYEEPTE